MPSVRELRDSLPASGATWTVHDRLAKDEELPQFAVGSSSDGLTLAVEAEDVAFDEIFAAEPGTPNLLARQVERGFVPTDELEDLVLQDMQVLGQDRESYQFFLALAYEVMDGYGRFLAFINRDQPQLNVPEPRPRSDNERLLEGARVAPYFIWPNVNPYRAQGSVVAAAIPPGVANSQAESDASLRRARRSARDARQQGTGVFDPADPLRLFPFEVRYLARRSPPGRWVIDLSRNDDVLIQPQNYYTIPNIEDRLFIPEAYVPLFVDAGWRRQP